MRELGPLLTFATHLIVVPSLLFWFVELFDGFPKLRLRQIAGIVAFVAWSCALFLNGEEVARLGRQTDPGPWLLTIAVVVLVFARGWKREFQIFMRMSDEDFPAKHGWILWALMLTLFAPIGVWTFRSYRKSLEANARLRNAIREPWRNLDDLLLERGEGMGKSDRPR